MATIRDALDKYKADQGKYPATLNDLVTKQYLRNVPVDPVTGSGDWTLLSDPTDATAGVYDVAAPFVQGAGSSAEPVHAPLKGAAQPSQLGTPATLPSSAS